MTKKTVPPMTNAEAEELKSHIPDRPDMSAEVLAEAIGPLPMYGIFKQNFEGLCEEHKRRIEGAAKQLKDSSYQFLAEGVDPLEFIVDTAKQLGVIELLLDLDNKARAKVAERKQASRSKP